MQLSDGETLAIVVKRLARLRGRYSWSEGVLGVDDAAQCLDSHDVRKVHDEQAAIKNTAQEAKQFRAEYVATRQAATASTSSSSTTNRGRARAAPKAAASSRAYPKKLPGESQIPHAEAKKYVPEGGHIRRGLQSGTWEGHFEGYKRVSRSWNRYGEHRALRLVLRDMWARWHEFHGIPESLCPISGMFDEDASDDD